MTQKDAMEGGPDPLAPDKSLFEGDDGDARENSPQAIRNIAKELRTAYEAMLGKGGRPNGNINQLGTDNELGAAQIGQWPDALALADTVGSHNAGVKFAEVYQKFIDAYKNVIEAVELSAENLDRARRGNEGDA
ncbi:hypothetical protein Nocox_05460 [Nonomuraea coxensis DSM 45129]|uniref:PE domain-containing protein n=1 Tax=Nonomuraea coxensis DSM 45129 TaxID=1122611 RepID=A0ABX8TTU8_9ACTN|nr:hypothetical protein [Nonomuraea coxensis]QYC38719.1 hypothetical protein Nocox_05460 [Nonomuraea coxensis DSM 45129]